ncbi:hypothetical protein BH09VER1_BH09VER1_23930 [soil metagenome]
MKSILTVLIGCMLLAACAVSRIQRPMVDTRPVGEGLNFLGIAVVLAALVLVFGKILGDSAVMRKAWLAYVLVGLLIILALVVAVVALPKLIIPIAVGAAVLVVLAVVGQRWR